MISTMKDYMEKDALFFRKLFLVEPMHVGHKDNKNGSDNKLIFIIKQPYYRPSVQRCTCDVYQLLWREENDKGILFDISHVNTDSWYH